MRPDGAVGTGGAREVYRPVVASPSGLRLGQLCVGNPYMHSPLRRDSRWFALIGLVLAGSPARSQWETTIGLTELRARYGASLPEGAGIVGWQTEAAITVNISSVDYQVYWPDLNNPSVTTGRTIEFSGPLPIPPDRTVTYSTHALDAGLNWYGSGTRGVSPDLSTLVFMEAGRFVNSGALQAMTSTAPVVNDPVIAALGMPKVINGSWAGEFSLAEVDIDATRRADYLVDRDGVTIVTPMAWRNDGTLWPTLGQGYNTIQVGLSSGAPLDGKSTVDGTGRVLVDVVVPVSPISYGMPLVAGAATLIADRAQETPSLGNADDPRVVRSLIMTGAEKLAGWSNSSTQPVDLEQGAGELRVNRMYDVLMAGEKTVGSVSELRGWDLGAGGSGVQYYYVDNTMGGAGDLTVTLTWNRVTGDPGDPTGSDRTDAANFTTLNSLTVLAASALADLSLEVLTTDGISTPLTSLAVSDSSLDNVEHIYLQNLAPGRYAIGVNGSLGTQYALSFNFVPEVPAGLPVGILGLAGLGYLGWRRRGD